MDAAIWVALISAGTTIITALIQNRVGKRNKAGSYILLLIIQDKVDYRIDGALPRNYDAIHDEYLTYHKNGGNGKITEAVENYDKWFRQLEMEKIEKDNKKKGSKKK